MSNASIISFIHRPLNEIMFDYVVGTFNFGLEHGWESCNAYSKICFVLWSCILRP